MPTRLTFLSGVMVHPAKITEHRRLFASQADRSFKVSSLLAWRAIYERFNIVADTARDFDWTGGKLENSR